MGTIYEIVDHSITLLGPRMSISGVAVRLTVEGISDFADTTKEGTKR
jgi:hypothetical protein